MITVNQDNYKVDADKVFLGYVGETNAREIDVNQPSIWGVSDYRIRIEYPDKTVYELPVRSNAISITGSILRCPCVVKMQWLAVKANGDSYELVAKSNIFSGVIKPSISDNIAPVPSYEQSKTVLDRVLEADSEIATKVAAAESAKNDAISAKNATEQLAETITADGEEIAENLSLAEQTLDEITALAQTAEADLEQVVDAVEEVQDAVTQVQQNTADIVDLKNDSNSCKQALFGKDKLTKLAKTSASGSNKALANDGTLMQTYVRRVYIYNIADFAKFRLKNNIASNVVFYNTATPISNAQTASESISIDNVLSVTTIEADTETEFSVPENALSFGVTVNNDNISISVVAVDENANKDGLADLSLMTENLYNSELMQYYPDPSHQRTGNIKVEPSTTYTVSQNAMILALPYQHNNYKGQFLDENLNEISKIETNPFTTPANCEYIFLPSRNSFINYKLEKGSDFTGYVPYGLKQDYPEYYKSPFKDKKFCAVGDSITAGQTSYVRGIVLKTGMKMLFDVNNPTAIPGSTVTKYGNGDTTREDYMCSTARVNAIPQDSEVILIMGGTNDYNATIGTLDGDHVETTFYGALQLMLDRIYARCPNADIFLCEMPYKLNETGIPHFEQRQQAIRDVAYKYGYPLLNTRAEGVNELNYTIYRQDGVHPNEAGRERLASLFAGQMKSFRG
ncbi:MAG: hypothetical protein IJU04_01485 [Ruminococcus sp.]|nr:hypothetical protein [Ruminococcus sp.]